MGDIGFVGRSAGLYDVFLGGDWANTRLNALFKGSVRFEGIISFLRPLLALWREKRLADETFGDFAHRVGFDALHAAVQTAIAV
jgi:sulfite reductase (ferredoxin)